MIKFLLQFLLGILLFAWANSSYVSDPLKIEIYGVLIGIAIAWLIHLVDFILDNRRILLVYWSSYSPLGGSRVRLTIAYLFKIEVQGKYLLIESKRFPGLFQPVGGAYKYFYPETRQLFTEIGFVPDTAIPNDLISENDLRFELPDKSNIPKFLNWFFSKKQREVDPWREFYEELVVPGILSETNFKYLHYELCAQHIEPIHYDTHFQKDTLKYADIYAPRYVDHAQSSEMQRLRTSQGSKYIWATEQEIINGVSQDGKRIGPHTIKIFHTKKISEK